MPAVIIAVVIIGAIVSVVAPYASSLGLYALPFAIAAWFASKPAGGVRKIEDISDEEAHVVLANAQNAKSGALGDIAAAQNEGRRKGIRYIERESRFENRSNAGQELNARISKLQAEIEDLESAIEDLADPDVRRFLLWRAEYLAWRQGFKYQYGAIGAMIGYFVTLGTLELVGARWPAELFPAFLPSTLAYASFGGWLGGFIGLAVGKSACQTKAESEIKVAQAAFSASLPEHDTSESDEFPSETSDANWLEVLNLDHECTIDDIKTAYREAIKRCHPDFVANLSEHIQEAAAEEALRLNNAYAQAREARGF